MVRIADKIIEASVLRRESESGSYIELIVPHSQPLTDEEMALFRDASAVEELVNNYGEVGEAGAVFKLAGWLSIEKVWDGIHFRWQTYSQTDLDQLKQENEDLTQALLELAEIVGGGNG